jgi:hypothetical protein
MDWSCELPESADVEVVEDLIVSEECDVLHPALRDEHAVELVSVFAGHRPAGCAWSMVMSSGRKPWPATHAATSAATSVAPGSLPRRAFVVISHAEAALTRTVFD